MVNRLSLLRSSRWSTVIGVVGLLALAAIPYRWVGDLDWTGVDGPALVEAARLDRPDWPQRVFWGELRAGVADSQFYRPVTAFTYGLDHIRAGSAPAPYHYTDLAIHLLVVLALWGLLAAHLGRRSVATWLGSAVFALNPIMQEVVPAIARRSETLVTLFMLLALWGATRVLRGQRAGMWIYGLACALAPLSKELGYLFPLYAVGLALAMSERKKAWRLFVVGVAVVVPVFGLRALVLGGLGGYSGLPFPSVRTMLATILDLFDPYRLLTLPGDLVLLAGLALLGVFAWRRGARGSQLIILGAIAALLPLVLFSAAGTFAQYYLYASTAGAALFVAGAAEYLHWAPRYRRALGFIPTAAVVVVMIVAAPWGGAPLEWQIISEATRDVRAQILEAARECPSGQPLYVAFLPNHAVRSDGRPGLLTALAPRDASHTALLALEGIERPVRALCYVSLEGMRHGVRTHIELRAKAAELTVLDLAAHVERPFTMDLDRKRLVRPGQDWIRATGFNYRLLRESVEIRWHSAPVRDCISVWSGDFELADAGG